MRPKCRKAFAQSLTGPAVGGETATVTTASEVPGVVSSSLDVVRRARGVHRCAGHGPGAARRQPRQWPAQRRQLRARGRALRVLVPAARACDLGDLGWTSAPGDTSPPVTIAYVEPVSSWSDRTHLVASEGWAEDAVPRNLSFFSGPLEQRQIEQTYVRKLTPFGELMFPFWSRDVLHYSLREIGLQFMIFAALSEDLGPEAHAPRVHVRAGADDLGGVGHGVSFRAL